MIDDESNTLTRHIDIMQNAKRRKQSSLSNGMYYEVNQILNNHYWKDLSSAKIVEKLEKDYAMSHLRWKNTKGQYSVAKIAGAIIEGERLRIALSKPVEVTGSAAALFQANLNSTRDNDEIDNPHRGALWGNKPDPEIRAKMTGGRANDTQVGGDHYRQQKIQHWDYVIANGIPYMEAQIIKYVSRWRTKNGLQDLEKALHFLQKLLEVEACTSAPDAKPCDCHSDDVNTAEQANSTTCQAEKISTDS